MAEQCVWMAGKVVSAREFHIDPEDEALLYGRGVFTTTRTHDGTPWLWDRHLLRVVESAAKIGIDILAELPEEADVERFVHKTGGGDCVIRFNLSASGRMWMIRRELPVAKESLRLTVSARRVWPEDPLASLKSFNYLTRHLAYKEALERGFDDAILLDPSDFVLETAHSNLFARFDDQWHTPPLTGGILPGIVREILLSKMGSNIDEGTLLLDELLDADEIVVTNSVLGLASVSTIDKKSYAVTRATQELARQVERYA